MFMSICFWVRGRENERVINKNCKFFFFFPSFNSKKKERKSLFIITIKLCMRNNYSFWFCFYFHHHLEFCLNHNVCVCVCIHKSFMTESKEKSPIHQFICKNERKCNQSSHTHTPHLYCIYHESSSIWLIIN